MRAHRRKTTPVGRPVADDRGGVWPQYRWLSDRMFHLQRGDTYTGAGAKAAATRKAKTHRSRGRFARVLKHPKMRGHYAVYTCVSRKTINRMGYEDPAAYWRKKRRKR